MKWVVGDFKQIHLIGAGGNGSYILEGLAKIISGFKLDVSVYVYDDDIVEEKNIYRQNFKSYEIGLNKALALCNRLNLEYGVDFNPIPKKVNYSYDIVDKFYFKSIYITAVDNLKARKVIADTVDSKSIWLDCGNDLHTGQIIIGNITNSDNFRQLKKYYLEDRNFVIYMPCVNFYYPDIFKNESESNEEVRHSCSDDPFSEQSIFINEVVAMAVKTALTDILIKKELTYNEIYVSSSPINIAKNRINLERVIGLIPKRKYPRKKIA
jgi:PRTRC genetic system ThiF family protein